MYNKEKLGLLLEKIVSDFDSLIRDYNKGYPETNYSLIFEELLFMRLVAVDEGLSNSYFNSVIEYFLTHDYKVTRFW